MSLRYSCRERHPQSGTIACPAASMLLLVPLGGLVLLQLRTSFCAHGINSCLARLQHILITTAAQPEALSSAFVSMSSLLPPHVENGFRLALVTAISRPSVCVPEGAFLFTYANKFHQDLMRMQMFPVQDESCIVSRYVALCFGGNWHPACVEAPALPAMGHHGALFYHHVLWVKWRLSRLALATQGCRMVLFLEADVVLLRNPFVAVVEHFGSLDHIDLLYSASARSLRALHARLEAESEKCVKAQSNTGILLVRNLSLVDAVIEEEPWVKIPGTPLDQELVDDVLGRPSSNKCNGADRRRGPAGYCQLKPLSGNDFRMTSWVAPGLTQHGSAAAGVAPLAR
ncbi:hypothetical protein AB1Y20_008790 [Prymnesium parvum]|uniref:Uncharacterized protein n=1 Tax=Prymnesium parvum TaxID=97485 RepID=A0AB34IUJ7_PRYPA